MPLHHHVGGQSHIFQPPQTQSSFTDLELSAASIISKDADHYISRKRPRRYSLEADTTSSSALCLINQDRTPETPGTLSPVPFVNTRYTLAGGVDTPTIAFASSNEYAISPDWAVRGGRGWHASHRASPGSYFPPLARERNGRARQHRSTQPSSWGRTMYNALGIAGKIWEFCKTSTFRGFHAGGGPGYGMHVPKDDETISQPCSEKGDALERGKWEVPGDFPDKNFIPDYMSQDHTASGRPAKRLQIEKGSDLSASWVMVQGTPTSREASPTRLSARKVPSKASPGRRPASKTGHRPILPVSRPSLIYFVGSPELRSNQPASSAPSRSPLPSPRDGSPMSAAVQKHAARIRRRELEEDANLRRFNQQLKAMIKEGKKALGTKFEIEDDFDSVDENTTKEI